MSELSADAPREKTFLLAVPETGVLTWIAQRLPARAWVIAGGMLTALGVRATKNLRTLAAAEPPATPRAA